MVFHDATEQRNVEKVQLESAEKLRFLARINAAENPHFESKWGSGLFQSAMNGTLPVPENAECSIMGLDPLCSSRRLR